MVKQNDYIDIKMNVKNFKIYSLKEKITDKLEKRVEYLTLLMPNLKELDLSGPDNLKYLKIICRNYDYTDLKTLNNMYTKNSGQTFEFNCENDTIETLYLINCKLTKMSLKNLKHLTLDNVDVNGVNLDGIENLNLYHCKNYIMPKNIKVLHIQDNEISDNDNICADKIIFQGCILNNITVDSKSISFERCILNNITFKDRYIDELIINSSRINVLNCNSNIATLQLYNNIFNNDFVFDNKFCNTSSTAESCKNIETLKYFLNIYEDGKFIKNEYTSIINETYTGKLDIAFNGNDKFNEQFKYKQNCIIETCSDEKVHNHHIHTSIKKAIDNIMTFNVYCPFDNIATYIANDNHLSNDAKLILLKNIGIDKRNCFTKHTFKEIIEHIFTYADNRYFSKNEFHDKINEIFYGADINECPLIIINKLVTILNDKHILDIKFPVNNLITNYIYNNKNVDEVIDDAKKHKIYINDDFSKKWLNIINDEYINVSKNLEYKVDLF